VVAARGGDEQGALGRLLPDDLGEVAEGRLARSLRLRRGVTAPRPSMAAAASLRRSAPTISIPGHSAASAALPGGTMQRSMAFSLRAEERSSAP